MKTLKKKIDFPVSAILFDLDGVLIDSIEYWRKAFDKTLDDFFSMKLTKEEFYSVVHDTTPIILKKVTAKYHTQESDIKNLTTYLEDYFIEKLAPEIPLSPNADIVIKKLHEKGYRLAVVTNSPTRIAEQIVFHLGLSIYFDVIIACDDCIPKPDPDLLLKAADRLNVNKDECIYIGDSPTDLIASKRAGMGFIAFITERKIPEFDAYSGPKAKSFDNILTLFAEKNFEQIH